MIPNMPALGIRFDIGKVKSGDYGTECWKVFWSAVDIQKLGGAQLFEGDTYGHFNWERECLCIAVQSICNAVLGEIQAAIVQSTEFHNVTASPKFILGVTSCSSIIVNV